MDIIIEEGEDYTAEPYFQDLVILNLKEYYIRYNIVLIRYNIIIIKISAVLTLITLLL